MFNFTDQKNKSQNYVNFILTLYETFNFAISFLMENKRATVQDSEKLMCSLRHSISDN